jgi:gamma-glutamyltranspeptidase/glutathione hydrolase
MSLADALAAPRFHHQWTPPTLFLEEGYDEAEKARLEELGHITKTNQSSGVSQAVGWAENGLLLGVHDPRVKGKAGGY